MAVKVFAGNFLTGTGAAASTVAVTGVGFTPKAIIFVCDGNTTLNTVNSIDLKASVGFAATGIGNGACAVFIDSGAATTDVCCYTTNSFAIVVLGSGAGAVAGSFSVTTLAADGFTITIGTAFAADCRVMFFCIGGEDIVNSKVGAFTNPTTATTKAITGVGFTPDVILMLCTATGSFDIPDTSDTKLMFGVATKKGQNGVAMGGSDDAQADTNSKCYQYNAESFALLDAAIASINARGTISSFDADGFTISLIEANGGAYQVIYLAIKGGDWDLGSLTTAADNSTSKVVSGYNQQAKGMIFFHTEGSVCTQDTPIDDFAFGLGFYASANYSSCFFEDYAAAATSNVQMILNNAGLLADIGSAGNLEVQATIPTVGLNGHTILAGTNTGPAAAFSNVLRVGDTRIKQGCNE